MSNVNHVKQILFHVIELKKQKSNKKTPTSFNRLNQVQRKVPGKTITILRWWKGGGAQYRIQPAIYSRATQRHRSRLNHC